LPVVLYGCETWLLTLKQESRLKVFENRVLRRIFGPRRDKVTEEWRKLHNEGLNDLYPSPNNFRAIKFEKNEIDITSSMYEGKKRYIQSFCGEI